MSEVPSEMYPRSLPFRAPDQQAAREAQLRRWTLLLAVGSVTALSVSVGLGAYLAQRTNRRADVAEKPEAPRPRPALLPPLREKEEDLAPREDKPVPPTPREKKPAETVKLPVEPLTPAPAVETKREKVLEALGGLAAAHLYQTYLNIGMLADAWENDVYTDAEAKDLLTKITGVVDRVDRQLADASKSGLEGDDLKAVERTRELTALLRTQARELKAYWETGDKKNADRYHKVREEAWTGISEVLKGPK